MRRTVHPALLALGLLLAGLTGVIAVELRGAAPLRTPGPVSPGRQAEAMPATDSMVVAGDQTGRLVSIILARPLFSPDRRPLETAGEVDPGLGRLSGVLVTAEGRTAIFAAAARGHPIVVSQGARVGRYVVSAIEEGSVTIEGPDGRQVLHPTFDPSPPPPVPQPPPAMAPAATPPRPAVAPR